MQVTKPIRNKAVRKRSQGTKRNNWQTLRGYCYYQIFSNAIQMKIIMKIIPWEPHNVKQELRKVEWLDEKGTSLKIFVKTK